MKVIIYTAIIAVIIGTIILFTGCAKLVSTECKKVEVTVVDIYYRAAYTTPLMIGKVMTTQVHPAAYKVYVEYNDVKYSISGQGVYHKYKDKIGQSVTGTLEIRTYDDDSVKYNIIELE